MAIAVRKSQAYHVQDWTSDETSLWVKLLFPFTNSLHHWYLLCSTCWIPKLTRG